MTTKPLTEEQQLADIAGEEMVTQTLSQLQQVPPEQALPTSESTQPETAPGLSSDPFESPNSQSQGGIPPQPPQQEQAPQVVPAQLQTQAPEVPQAVNQALPADVVNGIAGQVQQCINVVKQRAPTQLKLQRAEGKLVEALTWLNDESRSQQKATAE